MRLLTSLLLVGTLSVAACGAGGNNDGAEAPSPDATSGSADSSEVAAIEGRTLAVIESEDDWDGSLAFGPDGVEIVSVEQLGDTTAADAIYIASVDVSSAPPALVAASEAGAIITVVPADAVTPEVAAVLEPVAGGLDLHALLTVVVAVDDSVAAFEVAELGLPEPARLLTEVHLDRLEAIDDDRLAIEEPTEDMVIPAPEIVWVVERDSIVGAPGVHSRPVVVGDSIVFMGWDGVAYALDRATGSRRWATTLTEPGPQAGSILAASEGIVIANSGSTMAGDESPPPRGLFALDAETGAELWSIDVEDGIAGHPRIDQGTVYLWLEENSSAFVALALETGSTVWRTEAPPGAGQAAIHEGTIFAGSADGHLYGFDQATGRITFQFQTPALGLAGVASRPVFVDGRVLFGGDDGVFRSVDLESGDEVWRFETGTVELPSSPAIGDGLVVFGAITGEVYGLDIDTGTVTWSSDVRTSTGRAALVSSPAIEDGVVYIGGGGSDFYALDLASGEPLWRHETGPVSSSPVVVDGIVYVQTIEGLVALRAPVR